ncbi:MAG: hypothetical protein Q8L21_00615 [Candidatus Komeilibacteria bacterium]|nr:hypothetical protein [Candidatus Komeilibacteria bacterium]
MDDFTQITEIMPTPTPKTKKSVAVFISLAVVLILAGGIGLWWWQGNTSGFAKDWQAVFLTNGQVYFGKIAKQNQAEVILQDIYYLQVTQPLQQTDEGQKQANDQGKLSLVKLGSELHGPTDAMHINRSQILFIEDLRDDSNVSQAISNYKSGQRTGVPAATQPAAEAPKQ